ncbi:hypothetical protein [Streptomyces sp. NPDC058751]|uniref:hypothetical protein n=1 Tax=Streptomyces sp. NPDC058751 TaxID=3346623 RepID=UPI0036CB64FE
MGRQLVGMDELVEHWTHRSLNHSLVTQVTPMRPPTRSSTGESDAMQSVSRGARRSGVVLTLAAALLVGGCASQEDSSAESGPTAGLAESGTPSGEARDDAAPPAADTANPQDFPPALVGTWDGDSGKVSYRFDTSGNYTFAGVDPDLNVSMACSGRAQARDAMFVLTPDPNGSCSSAVERIPWSLEGLTLRLGTLRLTKDVPADSAECLLGTWDLDVAQETYPLSAWDGQTPDDVEIAQTGTDDSLGTLAFQADGTGTSSFTVYLRTTTAGTEVAVRHNVRYTFRYRVSGDTVSYSDVSGFGESTVLLDGTVLRTVPAKNESLPDTFECNSAAVSLSGEGYSYTYQRR